MIESNAAALELSGIGKSFAQGKSSLPILNDLDLRIGGGEIVALLGPSGSGKTTLLQIAGLLAPPDRGSVRIGGIACEGLNDAERTKMRRNKIGFVYQSHHLLPELSAEENVAMPLLLAGIAPGAAKAAARRLLAFTRIEHRAAHRPAELSGGEQQRVAIARALANTPQLVLADEPTGNLDPETGGQVFGALCDSLRQSGASALIVTHNMEIAARCDLVLRLEHGRIEGNSSP